jgi:hypothetical protein
MIPHRVACRAPIEEAAIEAPDGEVWFGMFSDPDGPRG